MRPALLALALALLTGCAPALRCDTDMDCARKFGTNGDPVPACTVRGDCPPAATNE